ncbi:MAG: putative addiction module component [Acidobacteriota bacterium]|nr:putative addiction module component [Acidobacteriota bacterium]
MTLEELRAQALGLDIDSRAALAQALLESLDQPSEQEVLRLALDEAEQRQADVRSGKVQMLPGEEVMDRLSKAFG